MAFAVAVLVAAPGVGCVDEFVLIDFVCVEVF